MRVTQSACPFFSDKMDGNNKVFWDDSNKWPAWWIDMPGTSGRLSSAVVFRCRFNLPAEEKIRFHVSADNRYILCLDGIRLGRGPERGDPKHWYFESFEKKLAAGDHVFTAIVWWLENDLSPYAQLGLRRGFILAAEDGACDIVSTGRAEWEVAEVEGLEFTPPGKAWGTGCRFSVDGSMYPWDWQRGDDSSLDWARAEKISVGSFGPALNVCEENWRLYPAEILSLPEIPVVGMTAVHLDSKPEEPVRSAHCLQYELRDWQSLLAQKKTLVLKANQTRRVLIDLQQYSTGYPILKFSGGVGARIDMRVVEALVEQKEKCNKGMRDRIEGKFTEGPLNTILSDGGKKREFSPLWWESGRYFEITVRTANDQLEIEEIGFSDTHYPFVMRDKFSCSDERINRLVPILKRSIERCAQETFLDCPYYEQLMYVGDVLTESLVTFVTSRDAALTRKALLMFDRSRNSLGLTQSRFPSKKKQYIPGYSAMWIIMVYNYFMWHGDFKTVRSLLPGMRSVMEYFYSHIDDNYLLQDIRGWNFFDWADGWDDGVPPGRKSDSCSLLNLLVSYAAQLKSRLEIFFGEKSLSYRDLVMARYLRESAIKSCWDESRRYMADSADKNTFSVHAQALAVLAGAVKGDAASDLLKRTVSDNDLTQCTFYFSHFLFEALQGVSAGHLILEKLEPWLQLSDNGFTTVPEQPEPSRSDCHGWGAHPLFHFYATILGIRPALPGFGKVDISPSIGRLEKVAGKIPHEKGIISVSLCNSAHTLNAEINLPEELDGAFRWNGKEFSLRSGRNILEISTEIIPEPVSLSK